MPKSKNKTEKKSRVARALDESGPAGWFMVRNYREYCRRSSGGVLRVWRRKRNNFWYGVDPMSEVRPFVDFDSLDGFRDKPMPIGVTLPVRAWLTMFTGMPSMKTAKSVPWSESKPRK